MHQGGISSPFSLVPERPRPEIRTPEARVSASQGTHFLRFPVGKGLCRQLPLPGAHSRGASWHCLWYAHEPQLLQSTPSRALTSRQVTTPILPRALAGKTPVSAPTSNMHSGPSLSTPSIQTPYLGAGAPSTIGGARGLAGLLGPGLGEEEVALPPPPPPPPRLRDLARAAGRRKVRAGRWGRRWGGGTCTDARRLERHF